MVSLIIWTLLYHWMPPKECFRAARESTLFLLGDSTFDNRRYATPAVADELRDLRPVLLAEDGATIADGYFQLRKIPAAARHATVILSIGGNDLLSRPENVDQLFDQYAALVAAIRARVDAHTSRVILATLYTPPRMQSLRPTVDRWNDRIRELSGGAPVLELAQLSGNPSFFVDTIEPSSLGSKAIAERIKRVLK